jgi:predicted transcriptional regulator
MDIHQVNIMTITTMELCMAAVVKKLKKRNVFVVNTDQELRGNLKYFFVNSFQEKPKNFFD